MLLILEYMVLWQLATFYTQHRALQLETRLISAPTLAHLFWCCSFSFSCISASFAPPLPFLSVYVYLMMSLPIFISDLCLVESFPADKDPQIKTFGNLFFTCWFLASSITFTVLSRHLEHSPFHTEVFHRVEK